MFILSFRSLEELIEQLSSILVYIMTTLQLIGPLGNNLLMSYSQLTQGIHFKHDFMRINAL